MAKKGITRERMGQMLRTLFQVLEEKPEGATAKEAIEAVAARLELTDHEKGDYEKGGRRFDKILRFGTVDAVKAGWMRKTRGVWTLTPEGLAALAAFPGAADFYREASRLYWEWKRGQGSGPPNPEEPDTRVAAKVTFEEAEEQAWEEIAAYLQTIDPYSLQELVASLLQAMGYHVSWIAGPGKDGGVDILAWTDPLGTKPPRIKVQVKRRKDSIKVEELRSFLALVNEDDVGLFVTTGGFTKDADELARTQERRKITLVDSERLVNLWIEYNDRIDKDKRSLLPLRPIYFLAPGD